MQYVIFHAPYFLPILSIAIALWSIEKAWEIFWGIDNWLRFWAQEKAKKARADIKKETGL